MFLAPPMREIPCDPDHDRGSIGDNPTGTQTGLLRKLIKID
jgi:hypothetical protein